MKRLEKDIENDQIPVQYFLLVQMIIFVKFRCDLRNINIKDSIWVRFTFKIVAVEFFREDHLQYFDLLVAVLFIIQNQYFEKMTRLLIITDGLINWGCSSEGECIYF